MSRVPGGYQTAASSYYTSSTDVTGSSVPTVSSNYGYGYGSVAEMSSYEAYSAFMAQSQKARQEAEAQRTRDALEKQKASQRTAATQSNLRQLAGYGVGAQASTSMQPPPPPQAKKSTTAMYGGRFVKAGQPPSAAAAAASSYNPVYTSTGRGFTPPVRGRGAGGPMRGVGRGRGGVTKKVAKPINLQELFSTLGKSIVPKSPSLGLLDMAGYNVCINPAEATDQDYEDFNEAEGYYPNWLHKCEIKIFGKTFSACATTKKDAREKAAEQAIPDFISARLQEQKERKKQVDDKGKALPIDEMEDEVPWASLCSVAVYKLYEDWVSEGFEIPEALYDFKGVGTIVADGTVSQEQEKLEQQQSTTTAGASSSSSSSAIATDNLQFKYVDFKAPGSTEQASIPVATPTQQALWDKKKKSLGPQPLPPGTSGTLAAGSSASAIPGPSLPKLPTRQTQFGSPINPLSKNPVSLLNELIPDLQYSCQQFGNRRPIYLTQIEVKGQSYSGEAYNKKESKLNAALHALKGAYGIEYPACHPNDLGLGLQ